jgi:O-antigen/teichoic acid export membrane protein
LINALKNRLTQNLTLIKNFSYLSVLHSVNALAQIATYPYLIRVVGKETFGVVIFAQAIVGYLVVMVNFGFNISAVKEIALNRNDNKKISEISSSVIILKVFLFFLTFLILSLLIYFIPFFRNEWMLFLLTMYLCLNEILFPVWYFQGIERMKNMAVLVFISKMIFLSTIFFFVKSKQDYLLIPALNGIGIVVSGLICFYIILVKDKIKIKIPSMSILMYHFKSAVPFFFSNASSQIYVNANKLIVGAFLGMTEVAYYDLSEKVLLIVKMPFVILNQVLFPKINIDKNPVFITKMFYFTLGFSLLIFVMIFLFANFIVTTLGGETMAPAASILRIMTISIPLVAASSFLCVHLLIPFGHTKIYFNIIAGSLVFYLLLFSITYFVTTFNLFQITLFSLVVELFVLFVSMIVVRKYQLLKFRY